MEETREHADAGTETFSDGQHSLDDIYDDSLPPSPASEKDDLAQADEVDFYEDPRHSHEDEDAVGTGGPGSTRNARRDSARRPRPLSIDADDAVGEWCQKLEQKCDSFCLRVHSRSDMDKAIGALEALGRTSS